jgi:hypothetical protein
MPASIRLTGRVIFMRLVAYQEIKCPVTIKFDNFAIKIDNLQLCLIKMASQRN